MVSMRLRVKQADQSSTDSTAFVARESEDRRRQRSRQGSCDGSHCGGDNIRESMRQASTYVLTQAVTDGKFNSEFCDSLFIRMGQEPPSIFSGTDWYMRIHPHAKGTHNLTGRRDSPNQTFCPLRKNWS